MKKIIYYLISLLFLIFFNTCSKVHYDKNVDLKLLLSSNEWVETEYTIIEYYIDDNKIKCDMFDKYNNCNIALIDYDCYKNFTYTFNFDDSIYAVIDCNDSIRLLEKSVDIKYIEFEDYKWQIQFDTLYFDYRGSNLDPQFYENLDRFNYWKVEYYDSKKIKVFRELHGSTGYLLKRVIYKTFEIKE